LVLEVLGSSGIILLNLFKIKRSIPKTLPTSATAFLAFKVLK